jgi:hypothetical protein
VSSIVLDMYRLLAPNYRKTVVHDQAWPAQMFDLLAGWQYMIEELGFEPKVRLTCAAFTDDTKECSCPRIKCRWTRMSCPDAIP